MSESHGMCPFHMDFFHLLIHTRGLSESLRGLIAYFFLLLSSALLYNVLRTQPVLEEHLNGFQCSGFMKKGSYKLLAFCVDRGFQLIWVNLWERDWGADGQNYIEI